MLRQNRIPARIGIDTLAALPLAEAALRIIEQAAAEGLTVRLSGSAACLLHCPNGRHLILRNGRMIRDVDLVGYLPEKRRLDTLLQDFGFRPEGRLMTIPGLRRSLFYAPSNAFRCDVFYDALEFCHTIDLRGCLEQNYPNLPLAYLLLQKLQIVRLASKDIQDVQALLCEHELGEGSTETMDIAHVSRLCARDWGLWRTVTGNLSIIGEITEQDMDLAASDVKVIMTRLHGLLEAIGKFPKSLGWRLRAIVGERWRWYENVEDLSVEI